ncbi:NAD(P)-dependent oxidoreductase [Streptomyces sp. NBC_01351]|uniref:NAD-dependent epimerase/dehydratase family protein n=1 Tax=Streptomyces sp. NBC_01351 TaxID=2903833 RepID=UPI002E342E49|nr:NAD(P)-dependent oxidoreductase [Streptomyces sp. NBC_01351]
MGMNETKNVLLAGASGVLGRHVAEALTRAGYTVIGLGRGAGAAVRADLMDRDGLLRAVDGLEADTVVHAATALRAAPMRHKDMFATDDLRLTGTGHLMEAARTVGARRVIAESMVFGYGYRDFGDHVITEDADPFGPPGDPAVERHLEGMRVKEQLVLGDRDIEGISLRFGLFYGAGGTEALVEMLRKRKIPAVADHGRVLPWVDLADAGRAVALAVEGGSPGQAYNIVDDTPMGFGAHVKAVAELFDTPKPLTVPTWLMRPFPYVHRVVTTSMRVSNAKAKAGLGWTPSHPGCLEAMGALAGK